MPHKKRSHVSNNCKQRCNTARKRIKRSNESEEKREQRLERKRTDTGSDRYTAPHSQTKDRLPAFPIMVLRSWSHLRLPTELDVLLPDCTRTSSGQQSLAALTKAKWSSCRRSRWYHQIPSCPFSSAAYSSQ